MKAVESLPEGYVEIASIDLQKNKKLALLVNGIALVLMSIMGFAMHRFVPITTLFYLESWVRFVALIGSAILYTILHELVHGVAMKLCGTKKVKYGFTGIYAFAGSKDYYGKGAYLFIALAPVVFWGLVLVVLNVLVPIEWFWVVYCVQIYNVSGAAGDMYVTARFSKLPADILVTDYGVGMKVYSKEVPPQA